MAARPRSCSSMGRPISTTRSGTPLSRRRRRRPTSSACGIRSTGGETKLFRDGDYPVLRGTALLLDDQTAYLWTTGYVPQLDTYIGPETPNPLHITVMRSKSVKPDIRTVLGDIMGLTKINYNSCN